jgi:hypothetical protein
MFPHNVTAAPSEVLKMISSKCSSENACSRRNCTCYGAQLSCGLLCQCSQNNCSNPWTVEDKDDESDEDTSDTDIDSE